MISILTPQIKLFALLLAMTYIAGHGVAERSCIILFIFRFQPSVFGYHRGEMAVIY